MRVEDGDEKGGWGCGWNLEMSVKMGMKDEDGGWDMSEHFQKL